MRIPDTQGQAVYRWEDEWKDWNRATMSPAAVRRVIRCAERLYAVRPAAFIAFPKRNRSSVIDLRTGKGKKLSTHYQPGAHYILIRPRHRNPAVALHEAAHLIHDEIFGSEVTMEHQVHGPFWLSIYLNLLIAAEIAPRTALLASAKAAGLEWAPLGKTLPGRIRRSYRGRIRKMKAAAR